jgi:hypothetical protein
MRKREDIMEQSVVDLVSALQEQHQQITKQYNIWDKAWKSIKIEMEKEAPDYATLKHYLSQLEAWGDSFPKDRENFNTLQSQVDQRYRNYISKYTGQIKNWCEANNLSLTGEFPEYTIDGLLDIKIDPNENTAYINKKSKKNISLQNIGNIILQEKKSLWDKPYNAKGFFNALRIAYNTVCTQKNIPLGEYAPILEVFRAMAKTKKKYTQPSFSADISQLLESGFFEDGKHVFELSPVRDSKRVILIYNRRTKEKVYRGLVKFTLKG